MEQLLVIWEKIQSMKIAKLELEEAMLNLKPVFIIDNYLMFVNS